MVRTCILCIPVAVSLLPCQPLQEWIARALEQNPTVQALQARWHAAAARIVPASTIADPMLMLGIENAPFGQPWSREPMSMLGASMVWRLAIPQQYRLQHQQATSDAELTQAELEEYRRWLRAAVTRTYAELWESQHQLRILRSTLQLLMQLDTLVGRRIETGSAGQREFFRLQLERSHLQLEIEREQERFAIHRATLAALVGEEHLDTVVLSEELPLPRRLAPRSVLYQRLQDNPRLRMSRADSLRAAAALELSRLWVFPETEFQIGYAYRPAPMEPTGSRFLWSFGFRLALPLWSGRRQRPTVEAASAELESRTAALRARSLELGATLEQLLARWQSLERQEALYRSQLLPQAEHLWEATTAEYAVGRADAEALAEALLQLYTIRRQWFALQAELLRLAADLHMLCGTLE